MLINAGFAPDSPVLWDTDWDQEAKTVALQRMDNGTRVDLVRRMERKLHIAGVQGDLNLLLRTTMGALVGWSRADLHALRANLVSLNLPQDVQTVDNVLRVAVRPVDTGGSPPQKKTPDGKTRVINMNYLLGQSDARLSTEFQHAQFFAQQARELNLELRILTTKAGQQDLLKGDVLQGVTVQWTIVTQVELSPWAEDSVEFLQSGAVAVLEKFVDSALREGMVAGRRARWARLPTPPMFEEFEKEIFHPMGSKEWVPEGIKVNTGRTAEMREAALATQGRPVAHLRFYAEGGNLIVGENAAGGTIVLVGRDAIAATRGEYSFADDRAVLALIAEDFGLSVDQVIPVEQPGKFHLDMGLLFIGRGRVVVNDSQQELSAAQARFEKFLNVPAAKKNFAKLRLQHSLENQAATDLTDAGLTVLRQKLESDTLYNFFNGEFVADGDGCVHYLTNGTDQKDPMALFMKLLVNDLRIAESVRLSPAAPASESLGNQGGVGCRIKGAPVLQ